MKILTAIDGDGHFKISPITDKQKSLEVLKSISDGDYFNNISRDCEMPNINECSNKEWEDYLYNFVQRGTCEIITYGDPALDLKQSLEDFYEYIGFVPNWVEYAIDFCLNDYWDTDGDTIWYGDNEDDVKYLSGDHCEDEVYTQRFYNEWVYTGEKYTMIFAHPGVDGINWFKVFDNSKRVKVND